MAAVALLLLGAEHDRRVELEPGALPGLEAARHRRDVGVAHVLEGLGREQRADAAGAVEDDRRVAVRDRALDLLLDVALGDVDGAGHVALLPLGGFADVDDGRGAGRQRVHLRGGHFIDLGTGLAEEVGVGLRHGAGWLRWDDGLAAGARAETKGGRPPGRPHDEWFGGGGGSDDSPAIRPADDTCSGARSRSMRRPRPGCGVEIRPDRRRRGPRARAGGCRG